VRIRAALPIGRVARRIFMRYGFVVDQDRCIGCHACTVVCKEENQVPVGVFRTWVKYIEKGAFPHTRRHFGVLRCNHCENAPCIEICPTRALYRRPDGIVDFDGRRCIGCKSCMQACPYDALYIDPNTLTASKCNFCAHRVEARLAPACVIVCPTQAIIAGDLDDPSSRVSRIVAEEKVSVRKPHKGTQPKLFYVGIEGDLLEPTRLERENGYFCTERHDRSAHPLPAARTNAGAGAANFDSQATREVYDVAHPTPWGWKIGAYLWTKSIAAGALLVAAALMGLSGGASSALTKIASPVVALVGLGLTGALLIFDLTRPKRFFYLLTKPNPRSWLVIGAWILMVYGGLAFAWLVMGFFGIAVPAALAWAAAAAGAAAACYSAFLFGQARGRDLWQSPLFFWHLLAHAFVAGSAVLSIVGVAIGAAGTILRPAAIILLIAVSASLAMILLETALPAVSQDAALAHQVLTRGRLSWRFWVLAVGAGSIIPIVLAAVALAFLPALAAIAAVFALAGLWSLQQLWIEAGQSVPLS
jgi:Fe-S-cluster-containing dehydrogenase component/formate-dependent nitrite reductase membrane component NrfD